MIAFILKVFLLPNNNDHCDDDEHDDNDNDDATTPRENEGIGNNSAATDMTIRNDDNLETGR